MKINIMRNLKWGDDEPWSLLQSSFESTGDSWHESQEVDDSDLHAFWGIKQSHGSKALAELKRSLVMELAYLGDRYNWVSLGFDGLNGRADFCNQNVEPDRWQKYWKDQMQPWNPTGEYALLVGQLPGDASLYGIDQYEWACGLIEQLKSKYGNVVYRPHPKFSKHHIKYRLMPNCHIDTQPLSESLKNAKVVITYNSNVGVDAIMAGKPVIAYDKGSMVYEISSHSIEDEIIMPDREDWGRKIAYAQWLPEELKNGEVWAHLRPFVFNKSTIIQEPMLMHNQNGALNEDTHAQKEFLALRDKHNLKYAIETGTCLGYTTEYLSQLYNIVHTVEISSEFKKLAYTNRLKNCKNVKMYEGSSSILLKQMIQDLPSKEGIFIFLDAHWGKVCPLKDELKQIANEGIKPVIAIHDFVVPNRPDLGFDKINGQPFNYEWLREDFDNIYGARNYEYYYNSEAVGAKRGIIYVLPNRSGNQ